MLVRDETSLRDLQISSIAKMLFLNKLDLTKIGRNSGSGNLLNNIDLENSFNTNELSWKVLVLDEKTIDIISSIMRVNDLLKCGITVHYLINQHRAPINDVPAIYFISPTLQNVESIINDIQNDNYSEFYINFSSTLPRDLLETLAKKVTLLGKADKIKQVFDQYLDFIVTEPELFSLEIPNTYSLLNNPSTTEETINTLCEKVADGLFNTVITTNTIPVIRAPVGGPAEIIAEKLGSKLRDYVINTRSSITGSSSQDSPESLERCVLIILDRDIDFASMFSHSWIYQCMVFDVFKLSKNIITIPSTDKATGTITNKKYDLDPNDFFWNNNSHLPFPEAAENVENALTKYKEDAEEITKKTGVSNLTDLDPNSNSDTLKIHEAVKKLPELTARKAVIDTHMNIFAALLSELESKSLDSFFEAEQDPDSAKIRTVFMDILKDNKTNNLEDKMRTFVYLYLTSKDGLQKDLIKDVETYFKNNEYDISAMKYVYKLREFMQLSNMTLQNKSLEDGSNKNSANAPSATNLTLSGLYGFTEGRLHGGVGSLISGIKKLIPEKKSIPITNVVEAIMDPLNSSQKNLETTDSYLFFDPRSTRGSHTKKPIRQSYNKSLVFIVGGGNYLEYQNLQEWAHSELHNPKKVMYGSTAITTPKAFLNEIATLGANN